jgi:nuclease S1
MAITLRSARAWLATALFLTCLQASAFGVMGHETIAGIAEKNLSPIARENVQRLLLSAPRSDVVALSTWADQLRDDEKATEAEKNTGRWHYMNFPPGQCTLSMQKACPDGVCLVPKLQQQLALLGNSKKTDAERAKALAFVVHLYGDLHQPLHLGFAKDKGGNDFQIQIKGYPVRPNPLMQNSAGINLHALWDTLVFMKPGRTEAQTRLSIEVNPVDSRLARITDVEAIARESCQIVQAPDFYPSKRKLDESYLSQIRPTAEARVALAGARLAKLLNRALRQREARR